MAKNKNILFPETAQKENDVAAPEPLRNAYDAVREGEGGEQEEAQHVSLGQWGTSRDYGFQEIYYDGMQDLFDISDDVGTKLFPFKDQDQPSMGSVRSENGVKQGIVPLTDFKQKREPVVSNTIYLDTPIVNIDQDFVASNPICYDIHGKLASERESDDERLVAQQESGNEKLVDGGKSGGRGDCVRKLVADDWQGHNCPHSRQAEDSIRQCSRLQGSIPHLLKPS